MVMGLKKWKWVLLGRDATEASHFSPPRLKLAWTLDVQSTGTAVHELGQSDQKLTLSCRAQG